MGLAVRVIPTLLADGARLVKGRSFGPTRVVGHVQQAARLHQARGVDELVVLDVSAQRQERGPDCAAVASLTASCFMPLAVGGGVRHVQDVEALLRAGADKVVVKTWWGMLPEMAARFGRQALVASLDYRDDQRDQVADWARLLERAGAGEIMLTSVAREGTMEGYDLPTIAAVADAVGVPVVARGGCSGAADALAAVRAGASAVGIGALFQFTDETPASVARYLADAGVEVRL